MRPLELDLTVVEAAYLQDLLTGQTEISSSGRNYHFIIFQFFFTYSF